MRAWISAAAICLQVISGASAADAATTLEPIRIEVPSAGNLQFLALWVALGAETFSQEGLKPEILVASTPRATGERLLAGEADVALLPPPMFLGMMAQNRPIRLFASLLANEPINLILRKEAAAAVHLSEKHSLYERLEALKGLKVGLASEVMPRLRALFRFAGLEADKDVEPVFLAGPEQVQALAEGRVQALFAHTPYLETALVEQGAVLVAAPSDGNVPALADGQVHALATTLDTLRNRPEAIGRLTRAIARAEDLIHRDPNATVEALIAYGGAGKDRQLLQAIAAIYGPAVPGTPDVSLAGIVRDARLYPAHPRAPDFKATRPENFVAPQFAERARSALP